MALTPKTLVDLTQVNTDLQDGDRLFVERSGVADYRTYAQVKSAVLGDIAKTGNGAEVVSAPDAGTSGQVAAWDGDGNLVDGGRMGMEWIATKTASSSANLSFTEFDAARYGSYVFVLQNLRPTTNATLWIRTSSDGGSSYSAGASDYTWGHYGINHGGSSVVGASDAADNQIVTWNGIFGPSPGEDTSGEVKLYSPATSNRRARFTWQMEQVSNSPSTASFTGSGSRLSEAVVNGVRFLYSTGNIATGSIVMYGLRNS